MKSFIVTSLLALFCIVVLAAPEANPTKQDGGNKGHSYLSDGGHKRHGCLSDRAVHKIVQRYVSLGEGSIDLLDQVVTEDVIFEDEQVNFTMELPPGPYAVGKEAVRRILEFVHSQSGFKTIKIEPLLIVHDCDTISFRWQSTLEATGLNPNSTAEAGDLITYKGIDILEIEKGTKLIEKSISSSDYLVLIYHSGVKLCFQKDAPKPVCSD